MSSVSSGAGERIAYFCSVREATGGSGDAAQLVEACLAMHGALGSVPSIMEKPSTVVSVLGDRGRKTQTWKAIFGFILNWSQPGLHKDPVSKNKKQTKPKQITECKCLDFPKNYLTCISYLQMNHFNHPLAIHANDRLVYLHYCLHLKNSSSF